MQPAQLTTMATILRKAESIAEEWRSQYSVLLLARSQMEPLHGPRLDGTSRLLISLGPLSPTTNHGVDSSNPWRF